MSKFDVLIDSDAFVGLFYQNDAHHQKSSKIFDQMQQSQHRLVTTNMVVAETATVLSHRVGQKAARTFLDLADMLPVIFVNEHLYRETLLLFRKQTTKGTSVVDCSNVIVIRKFDIPTILSFDKVYTKDFKLKIAA